MNLKHINQTQFLKHFSKISPYTIYAVVLIILISMFTNRRIANLALTTYMGRLGLSLLVVLAGLCHKLIGVAAVFAIIVLQNIIFIYEPFESISDTSNVLKSTNYLEKQQLYEKDDVSALNHTNTDAIEGYATLEIERSMYGKNSSDFF
jgi:hypothetical protein